MPPLSHLEAADVEIVLEVATGRDGVIEGTRVRRFVDLSTTGAVMAKRIFEALKPGGVFFILYSQPLPCRSRRGIP